MWGFQSPHLKFFGNSYIDQWKMRVQMTSKGSTCKGTNLGVKPTFFSTV